MIKKLKRNFLKFLDSILTFAFGLFSKNKFTLRLSKIRFYKKIGASYLYDRAWSEMMGFLFFAHDINGLSSDRFEGGTVVIDLSDHGLCKGFKIRTYDLCSSRDEDRRNIGIKFVKEGVIKFSDKIGYIKNGNLISVSREDRIRPDTVKTIINFVETVSFDSTENKKELLQSGSS